MKEIEWRGFKGYEFEFEGLPANLIKPNCKPNGKQLLKAEYFDAFPEMEIEFLNRGWHLAYNQNYNRWVEDLDLQRKSKFLEYRHNFTCLDNIIVTNDMIPFLRTIGEQTLEAL